MLYQDPLRGLVVPLAICVFGTIALVRAALAGGVSFAPLLLAACLIALGVVRLRFFVRARREGRHRAS